MGISLILIIVKEAASRHHEKLRRPDNRSACGTTTRRLPDALRLSGLRDCWEIVNGNIYWV